MLEQFLKRMTPGEKSKELTTIKILAIVLTIVVTILAWISIDKIPAVPEDFVPLYEQLKSVEGKPAEFVMNKGKVIIDEEKITYIIENSQCEMTGVYNRDYELISSSQKDKAMPVFAAVVSCVLVIAFAFVLGIVILYILFFIFGLIYIMISTLYNKIFKKKPNVVDEDVKDESEET